MIETLIEDGFLFPMLMGSAAGWYLFTMSRYRENRSLKDLVSSWISYIIGMAITVYFYLN